MIDHRPGRPRVCVQMWLQLRRVEPNNATLTLTVEIIIIMRGAALMKPDLAFKSLEEVRTSGEDVMSEVWEGPEANVVEG